MKPSCFSLSLARAKMSRAVAGESGSSIAERPPQLHRRPVVERVAERLGHRARPGLELVEVRRVAGAELLRDAVRAHRPPLVVVALEPDLGDRAEAVVRRHQLRREVAVVVDDRQVLRRAVVELARRLGLEQEVVVEEGLHGGLAQAVFSAGIGSNFGASRWWIGEGHEVGEGADAEQDRVTPGDVPGRLEAVEQRAGEDREDEPAGRPRHAAEAGDRGDVLLREHVGDGRVEVRRPGLMRRAGEADQEHRGPVADPRHREDGQDAQREREHARLARPAHAPAVAGSGTRAASRRRCSAPSRSCRS